MDIALLPANDPSFVQHRIGASLYLAGHIQSLNHHELADGLMQKSQDRAVGPAGILAELLEQLAEQEGRRTKHQTAHTKGNGKSGSDPQQGDHRRHQTGHQANDADGKTQDTAINRGCVAVHPLDQITAVDTADAAVITVQNVVQNGMFEITLKPLPHIRADKLVHKTADQIEQAQTQQRDTRYRQRSAVTDNGVVDHGLGRQRKLDAGIGCSRIQRRGKYHHRNTLSDFPVDPAEIINLRSLRQGSFLPSCICVLCKKHILPLDTLYTIISRKCDLSMTLSGKFLLFQKRFP